MKKMIMASLAVLMLVSLAACHQEPKKPVTLGGTAAGWSRTSGTSTSLQGSGTCQYSASACQSCLAAPPRGDTGNCTAYCTSC